MNSLLFIRVQPYSLSPPILTHLHLRSPFAGDIGTLVLPEGMQDLNLYGCSSLTGDIGTLVLPEGMQNLYLNDCSGLTSKTKG